MLEQEKRQETHLFILLVYTLLCMALIGESILLGWELNALILVLLGLVVSWGVHVTEIIPPMWRMWIYFGFSMITFFFYGIHETSMYDLAPTIIGIIMLYSAIESYMMVRLSVLVYFLTVGYNFIFVVEDRIELTPLIVSRTAWHFALVCLASYLAKKTMQRRSRERQETDNIIKEMEEINLRTENFLANVSREFCTSTNTVTEIASKMLKNEEDTERRKEIYSIQLAGSRLAGQIGNILDYMEIGTGKAAALEEVYRISSLVSSMITEYRLQEKNRKLEVIFDVDAGIPSSLIGDEKKLKKILGHLIDNAVKFTDQGGVYVRIYALKKPYGINLCISVSDTGSGISQKDVEKIKERFYQVNEGKDRQADGLGLGLSIVYGLVSVLEGFMRIESIPGEGTTISVSIPQKVADEAPGMSVERRQDLCVACFIRTEKFEVPKVRTYYESLISNMVGELGISLHRIYSEDELERLVNRYRLTHLFIGEREYRENERMFESLDQSIKVIVAAGDSFTLPQGAHAKILEKPFSVLDVVNVLNLKEPEPVLDTIAEDAAAATEDAAVETTEADRMSCLEQMGIHTHSGMRYCSNDEDFYVGILLDFARSGVQKAAEMQSCYEQKNWKDYGIKVHALKSAARMVGADALSEMAEKLEAAAKNPDTDFIRNHHQELLDSYGRIRRHILEILGSENGYAEGNEA